MATRTHDPLDENPDIDWSDVPDSDSGDTPSDPRARVETVGFGRTARAKQRARLAALEADLGGGGGADGEGGAENDDDGDPRPRTVSDDGAGAGQPPTTAAPVHVHVHPPGSGSGDDGGDGGVASAPKKPRKGRRKNAETPDAGFYAQGGNGAYAQPAPQHLPLGPVPAPVYPPAATTDNVFEWLRGFDLRPGIRAYTLQRLAPTEYQDAQGRMQPTSGTVEQDCTLPVTEVMLSRKWGGQTWEFTVYERGVDGQERRIGQRRVTIASAPVAYLAGTKRIPLDPENDPMADRRGRPRRYDDEVIPDDDRPQLFDSDDGGMWRGPGRGPLFPGHRRSPLAEFAQQRVGETSDLIRTVSDTINRGQERADKLLQQTLGQLNDQLKSVQEKGDGPALQALTMLQEQIRLLAQRHEAVTESIRTSANEQLTNLRETLNNELRREQETHRSDRDRWDREFKEAVDKRERDYRDGLAQRDKLHGEDIARIERLATEERRANDERWRAIVEAKDRDVERMKSERDRDLDRVRADTDRLLTDQKERHAEAIRAMREESQRRADDLGRSLTDLKDRHADAEKRLREDSDRRAQELQRHSDLMLTTVTQERDKLRDELAHIRAENLGLRDKANPSMDAMLRQIGGVADGLKSLGLIKGGGGDEDGGFDPKKFFFERIGVAADNLSEALATMATAKAQQAQPQAPQYGWTQPGAAAYPPMHPAQAQAYAAAQAVAAQAAQIQPPMTAGPIRTAPPPKPPQPSTPPAQPATAPAAATAQPDATASSGEGPEVDERTAAVMQQLSPEQAQTIANLVAAVESERAKGTTAAQIVEFLAESQPALVAQIAGLDVEAAIAIAYEHGLESAATPAARRYLSDLHAAIVARVRGKGA